MAIYRGDGGAGDATNDITINQITELSSDAQAAATAAASSATSASSSASAASTSATNAANSATSAGTSATNAASSASSASTSASNASTSETNAAASATAAAASEAAAALSETAAAASETNAATSAINAATSETNASNSATAAASSAGVAALNATSAADSASSAATSASNAATSETNAASSATSASNDAATATTKASEASTSASNAATSETNAAASESAAATSATNASTSETNAAASETAAASSASAAATSETNAATSASNASTSETNALASANNAATSETNAAASAANALVSETNAAGSAVDAANSAASIVQRPPTTSASRNQVMNQDPISQGEAQRTGFSATKYTGNGTSQSIDTGIDMATGNFGGLVWIKNRDGANSHVLLDTVRGATNRIVSDSTGAEVTDPDTLTSFNSSGFSIGADLKVNINTNDYISWNWQTTKKTTGTTNRNKSYTAHYNPDMGFSIVGYEGDGVGGHEIPHHLGREPELTIFKNRDRIINWQVISKYVGDSTSNDYLQINTTDSILNSINRGGRFNVETVTLLGASDRTANETGENIISYNFTSVDGFSKVGKYIGTGAAGNYVDCGFKPSFVLVKNLTTAQNWSLLDSARGGSSALFPNLSNAEGVSAVLDFTDDGFVIKTTAAVNNELNSEFLFLAFAETATTGTRATGDYDYATNADTLTVNQNTLISFANGFDANGELNTLELVGAGTTFTLGAGFEDEQYYFYKDKDGSYGVTEYRPLEQQDYSGVASPLGGGTRTTAKHFDYESSTGVVSASAEDTINTLAYLAFNKDGESTRWQSNTTADSLQYKLAEPRVLKSYRMMEWRDATRTPRRFTIEGSNDGLNWIAIDSTYTASDYVGNGVSLWGDLQDTSSNTTAYLYHRINVTAVNGGTVVSIAELELNTITPSDIYDVRSGVMKNSAGTPIERTYLASFRTDSAGDIILDTIKQDFETGKTKAVNAEFHGDVKVRGKIENSQVATAWVNFDGSQNPPLIRDSYNVKDVVDLSTGQYEIVFETPMTKLGYGAVAAKNTTSTGSTSTVTVLGHSINSVQVRVVASGAYADAAIVTVTTFGGKE